jgi:hypothetical protein
MSTPKCASIAHNVSNAPVPTEDFRVIFNYTINF